MTNNRDECSKIDCKNIPEYNFDNSKIPIFCYNHKLQTMVKIKNVKKKLKNNSNIILDNNNSIMKKDNIIKKDNRNNILKIDDRNKLIKKDNKNKIQI